MPESTLNVYAGTSGYSYKEWKGPFYPEKLKNNDMLSFYAERFKTVEINNTFYRMPKPEVVQKWHDEVPAGFRFILKASRRITHMSRLKNADDSLGYLLEVSSPLREKRGPILFQLPPNMKKDKERLESFLKLVPEGVRVAFEFRNASWNDDEIFDVLRERGACLCIADSGNEYDAPVTATADFGYLRLRREGYDEKDLNEWAEKVQGLGWKDVFVFFKHEDDGAGPEMAAQFEALFS